MTPFYIMGGYCSKLNYEEIISNSGVNANEIDSNEVGNDGNSGNNSRTSPALETHYDAYDDESGSSYGSIGYSGSYYGVSFIGSSYGDSDRIPTSIPATGAVSASVSELLMETPVADTISQNVMLTNDFYVFLDSKIEEIKNSLKTNNWVGLTIPEKFLKVISPPEILNTNTIAGYLSKQMLMQVDVELDNLRLTIIVRDLY